ncbi:MAG: sugar ABC transporter permease [Atribacterota bacterium]|nr:sugar ABC transporter permease [Atribacterota bacterium]
MCKINIKIFLYILPALLLIFGFIYFPVIQNLIFSFYRWSAFSVEKKFVGLNYYKRLFFDKTFYICLRNNSLFGVISLIFQVGFGLVIASILDEKFIRKMEPFFRTVFFIPSLISLTVTGLLWVFILNPQIGILNAALKAVGLGRYAYSWLGNSSTAIYAVIGVSQWQYTGYIVLLFIVAIQKIPPELYEVALLDGANYIQKFIYVTIPQVKGMILLASVITIIGAFKVFDHIYVMTAGGPGRSTEVLATYLYRSAFRNDEMGLAAALGFVIFVITFIISVVQIKLYNVED